MSAVVSHKMSAVHTRFHSPAQHRGIEREVEFPRERLAALVGLIEHRATRRWATVDVAPARDLGRVRAHVRARADARREPLDNLRHATRWRYGGKGGEGELGGVGAGW